MDNDRRIGAIDRGAEFMNLLSLLMLGSLPLLQAGEHDRSHTLRHDRSTPLHARASLDPGTLDRHPDEGCPCELTDGSPAGSVEDDDSLEDLLLGRDKLHSWASQDPDSNALAWVARGLESHFHSARSLPLLC
jgi:hypothetical protein